jgi:hypothetical protein
LVIDYLREKRKERIKSQAKQIIKHHIEEYIDKKREKKKVVLFDYFHYCATIIAKFYRGYKVRNDMHDLVYSRKTAKQKIMKMILSFKIRFVLRSMKLQDLLIEIANVKHLLANLRNEDPSEKSERLNKELSGKLPRLQLTFYEQFYLMKRKKWVNQVKVNTHWFESYIKNLYNPEESVMQGVGKNYDSIDRMTIIERRIVDIDDHDNRPIKSGGIGSYNLDQYPEFNEEGSPIKEKKRPDRIRKKQPKYDARKAIEEAKLKESTKENDDKPISKEKNGLRGFLKSMKVEGKKEKEESNNPEIIPEKEEKDLANIKAEVVKKTRANRIDLSRRQKLHEMEKSPPPRVHLYLNRSIQKISKVK